MKVNRQTVDLSSYPDLVVIYLGMRVNALAGLKTLAGFGPKIADSVAAGFQAGRIPFASAIATLAPLASSSNRFVATAPTGLLTFAHDYLMAGGQERGDRV